MARTQDWGASPEMFGPRHEFRLGLFLREAESIRPGARVLDAAVGFGYLAARLARRGHRVFGIDTSFEAVHHAVNESGVPALVGDLTNLPFRDGTFDAVTSGETLEHLDDDRGAVREISRVLIEGGRCVATVPAMKVLWSGSDEFQQHRRRYERKDLEDLFRAASMTVDRASFWGFPFVLAYDFLFLLPMNRRRAATDESRDTALQAVARAGRRRWLVRFVMGVFSVDRLFSFVPFGPGLLVVARKK